jgi:hypothetical protein
MKYAFYVLILPFFCIGCGDSSGVTVQPIGTSLEDALSSCTYESSDAVNTAYGQALQLYQNCLSGIPPADSVEAIPGRCGLMFYRVMEQAFVHCGMSDDAATETFVEQIDFPEKTSIRAQFPHYGPYANE